jgi:hypothetical protein
MLTIFPDNVLALIHKTMLLPNLTLRSFVFLHSWILQRGMSKALLFKSVRLAMPDAPHPA